MFVIIVNSSNVVPDGTNSAFVYNFPNSVVLKDKYIAVSQIIMYYSWFNISDIYLNNNLTYTWTVGGVSTTYNIIIPNGIYNITDINFYCQFTMISNGHYLINDLGSNVYYFEILVNVTRYAVQINTYQVPTSLPVGWSQPGNFDGYPTLSFNPIITIPNSFNKIIGYTPIGGVIFSSDNNINNAYVAPTPSKSNYFVSKNAIGNISYLSNTYPDVQPNSSIYLSMSNINNPYSQPSSIMYAITPSVGIGEQITESPPSFMWNEMINGTYNQLRFQLLGIDKSPIQIGDPNVTFIFTIKDKNEML